VQDGVSVTTDH